MVGVGSHCVSEPQSQTWLRSAETQPGHLQNGAVPAPTWSRGNEATETVSRPHSVHGRGLVVLSSLRAGLPPQQWRGLLQHSHSFSGGNSESL